jgi:hypothetical protein
MISVRLDLFKFREKDYLRGLLESGRFKGKILKRKSFFEALTHSSPWLIFSDHYI